MALVCDICGGKLLMDSGGVAKCDHCGMEYTQERLKEKIKGVNLVSADKQHEIDTWMRMGSSAAEAGNYKEAYKYFTKVVEVDPRNWRAIYEKGKAGAWQSTLDNMRISEIYQGITTALEIIDSISISEDDTIKIKNEFAVALYDINCAVTDLMADNLRKVKDKYLDLHREQMKSTRQRYITNVSKLEDAMALIEDLDDELSKENTLEFKKRMCDDLRDACCSINYMYWGDYSQLSVGFLGFEVSEKQEYLDKYWHLVDEIREVEPQFATDKWLYPDPFEPGMFDVDRVYRYWSCREKAQQEKREQAQRMRRFEAYWQEHAKEKEQLVSEKNSIEEQLSLYNTQISGIPERKGKDQLEQLLGKLLKERDSLGFFKGKDKKVLQTQINELKAELSSVSEKIAAKEAAIRKQIEPLEKRIAQIDAELTKPR